VALSLASQAKDLTQIMVLMAIFGVGAAAPFVILGSLSRVSPVKVRGRLLNASRYGKQVFGSSMLCFGILIVSGADKSVEA
jgi:cytochrome c-type biogenesis protein